MRLENQFIGGIMAFEPIEPAQMKETAEKTKDGFFAQQCNLRGRPAFYDTPEKMEKRLTEYFEICHATKRRATKPGMMLFLDFADRQSLYAYKRKSAGFNYLLKKAERMIQENLCQQETPMAMFQLKAFYGLSENSHDNSEDDDQEDDGFDEQMNAATKAAFGE